MTDQRTKAAPHNQPGTPEERHARLAEAARQLRVEILRMTAQAGSGHPGGSLSSAEIIACLYFDVLRLDPARPSWPERDRFVLSKGHAAPVLYAALALRGFFPRELLATLRKTGSCLQGHPHMRTTPGVEVSTGSLGQGLSMACGLAAAARIDGAGWRTWCLLGDGETQEGQVWEAAEAAAHFRLDNLVALVDNNGLQIDGPVSQVMAVDQVPRWQSFGWRVLEADGHSIPDLLAAMQAALAGSGRPAVIVCRTTKGKGVSFMEGQADWHGKAPTPEQLARALEELGCSGQGPALPGGVSR
ncbi:MAG: transketolase [Bacillota bacterium]|nr:transketolase [Bacillota bacterium]